MADVKVSSPNTIQGCTIKNDSDGDCDVELEYGVSGKHATKLKFGVPKNTQREQKEAKIAEMPGRIRINIVRITITRRKNGETITLTEPFDFVVNPSPNWLFTISNDGFDSVRSLAHY